MSVSIIENFNLGTDKPLDNRYVVNSYNDVSMYWYTGMQVYQLNDNQLYWYNGVVWTAVLDTSVNEDWKGYVDGSLSTRDLSINDLYTNKVDRSGDVMSGQLTTTALGVTGDISLGGALYLGDDTSAGTEDTDLLAVVTATGKIVATSIPAGNVELGVTDVITDIDVSILSGIYYVDTTAGDITMTLPVVDASYDGRSFNIIKKTSDVNDVIVQVEGSSQEIGSSYIQVISQPDKGFRLVADNDNSKYLITQDSRYLEGNTQGEFQYWDVPSRSWLPTSSDITWDNTNKQFVVGGNSSPPTFEVDASNDIVYINAGDLDVNNPTDDLGFYAGGRGAFGNSVTIDRLRNNVPGNVPRALSLIDTTGVIRVWRFVSDGGDPAVEFVWGTADSPSDAANAWWDMYLDGANDGTDSFAIRRRTGNNNTNLLTAFADRVEIAPTTESTDTDTGSLQVAGGAGFKGNINTTGSINPGGSTPSSAFPTPNNGGELFFRSDLNMMFIYDETRTKWLSMERHTFVGGVERANGGTETYLQVGTADMSSTSGFVMPKNGTLLGLNIRNRVTQNDDRTISLRGNDVNLHSIVMPTGNNQIYDSSINEDFNQGDIIQVVFEDDGTSNIRDAFVSFEVAWKE